MFVILPPLVYIKGQPLASVPSCSFFLLIHFPYHDHFSRVLHPELQFLYFSGFKGKISFDIYRSVNDGVNCVFFFSLGDKAGKKRDKIHCTDWYHRIDSVLLSSN